MPKRTEDLTVAAKPVADELAARCGSLKHVLSAGVLALQALLPEQREEFMEEAVALEIPKRAKLNANEALIEKLQYERKRRQSQQKLIKQILSNPSLPEDAKAAIVEAQRNMEQELQTAIKNRRLAKTADSG